MSIAKALTSCIFFSIFTGCYHNPYVKNTPLSVEGCPTQDILVPAWEWKELGTWKPVYADQVDDTYVCIDQAMFEAVVCNPHHKVEPDEALSLAMVTLPATEWGRHFDIDIFNLNISVERMKASLSAGNDGNPYNDPLISVYIGKLRKKIGCQD